MSDKEFDKIFGDKLRAERSFSSIDSDWGNLAKRLDETAVVTEKEKKHRIATWLWLLPFLLILPITTLLVVQMNDLKQQNKQLAEKLEAVQNQLNTRTYDTIYKVDTVFITQSRGDAPKTKSTFHSSKIHKPTPSISNEFSTPKNLQTLPLEQSTSSMSFVESTFSSGTSKTTMSDTTPSKRIAELLEKLADLDKQIAGLHQELAGSKTQAAALTECSAQQDMLKKQLLAWTNLVDSLQKHPLSSQTLKSENKDKTLKNNRLFIGLKGGQIKYKTEWVNTVGVEIYKNLNSYQAGVSLEYALSDKLRVTASGDFCPVSYQIFWQDSRYNLPALQYDAAKEKYQKAESKQTFLQANMGVKYFFTESDNKWRPYIGTAYTLMHIRPFSTKFTYVPLWGTGSREQTVQSEAFNIPNLLLANGGLEYRFSKNMVAQAEAFYYKDINKKAKTFDLLGLRAAVLLNIK
ncbi:MAG: autotransporter outer membrane beta-barrel domain-containing protein [Saprospiraceae bacterium]|nr:autotransporter outer membrane beta-barrel domain-containing protein [Saprospiraceae bacterium]